MPARRIIPAFMLTVAIAVWGATARAQTDIGASLYGAFSGTTNANGTVQSPSNAAGGLLELRHLANPIVGFEATYSFNRANERYRSSTFGCPVSTSNCLPTTQTIKANAHEVTVDWVPSLKIGSFRPFGVLGVGALFDVPVGSQSNADTTTKAVYVYGAGLDWGLLPHLGLRFQYRGNLYKAPDVSKLYTSADAFRHTAEPMIGAYFSF